MQRYDVGVATLGYDYESAIAKEYQERAEFFGKSYHYVEPLHGTYLPRKQ